MTDASFADRVHGVAALDHPVTRATYRLLGERGEVSRDAVAEALDLARSVAAFHLDKLADAGLADVRFARLTGRSGPGAGRTAKLYRRVDAEVGVSLPERRYDLAGAVLAEAVERATTDGLPLAGALRRSAVEAGRRMAEGAADGGAGDRGRRRDAIVAVLERYGYEPRSQDDEIVLGNCPFHRLAEHHRDLVCEMNLDLLGGVIEGAGGGDVIEARLAPEPGCCCVRMTTR
jgi:predicted ArsR family transcriptional regulator